jgi:type II secretory pathway pseudopilin PulG
MLLLVVCVMTIAAAAIASTIAFEIKRDREEEFIHRAVQYSRAIRRYAKSTGRYPLDLQDLNGRNGVRYIRKLYKDPITGQDFRLLYTSDILNATSKIPQNGQPVQGDVENGAADPNQSPDTANAPSDGEQNSANTQPVNPGDQPPPQQVNTAPPSRFALPVASTASNGSGLGTIFGVASKSKEKTIREFEHKNHYNEWLFFYDQAHETGFLVNGPTRLTLPIPNQLGQPAAGSSPGQSASGAAAPGLTPPGDTPQ